MADGVSTLPASQGRRALFQVPLPARWCACNAAARKMPQMWGRSGL